MTAFTVKYDDSFTDDEIDQTLRQAKALGASVVHQRGEGNPFSGSCSGYRRETWVEHCGDYDVRLCARSARWVDLDIGFFTSAGASAAAWLQENAGCVSQLTVKDRRRNSDKSEQWGDGDTPVKDVLRLVKTKGYAFPVFAEYEYLGLGTSTEELQRCMDYMRSAIA